MTILQKKIKLKSQLFHKIFFLYHFLLPTLNTTTYSLSVSVSADMKNCISVFYRYRPIRKLYLSAFIGIGRYEKKLIGRTLSPLRQTIRLPQMELFFRILIFAMGSVVKTDALLM